MRPASRTIWCASAGCFCWHHLAWRRLLAPFHGRRRQKENQEDLLDRVNQARRHWLCVVGFG